MRYRLHKKVKVRPVDGILRPLEYDMKIIEFDTYVTPEDLRTREKVLDAVTQSMCKYGAKPKCVNMSMDVYASIVKCATNSQQGLIFPVEIEGVPIHGVNHGFKYIDVVMEDIVAEQFKNYLFKMYEE